MGEREPPAREPSSVPLDFLRELLCFSFYASFAGASRFRESAGYCLSNTVVCASAAFMGEPVTAPTIRCTMPSMASPWCQCHTNTMSSSGSIQMVFPPLPMAAKLDAGPLGHCFCFVFSHHR